MRRLHLILALFVAGAALLSWWLRDPPDDDRGVVVRPPDGPREIDYRVRDFEVVRMTPDGVPAHRLSADTLWNFTDDDTTELAQPHLTVFQGTEPPWEIDAEQAWLSADGDIVLLAGEVLIERASYGEVPPTTIKTRNLRVRPREDYAETDEAVRVETDSDWLDAVGMQVWLRPPSRIKFLSNVQGFYVPR